MWFAFGLVTLVGAAAYTGYRRYAANWSGIRQRGYEYPATKRPKSDKLQHVRISLPTRSTLDFECKPESAADRFFKRLGLAREHQIGCRSFDEAVYVVSDHDHVRKSLLGSRELSDEILFLFANSAHEDFRLRRLTCRGGRVWLDYHVRGDHTDAFAHFEAVRPGLAKVVACLPARLRADEPDRDPLFLRSVILLAISSGLAINGAVQLARLSFLSSAFTVDTAELWWAAVGVGGLLLLVLCAAAVALLGRSSRAHLVLAELLLLGSFGAVSSCFTEIRDLNMELDDRPATVLVTDVLDKSSYSGRRSRRRYYLHLRDWNGLGASKKVQVPRDLYDSASPGQAFEVHQRAGWAGIRWVERLSPSWR